MASPSRVLVQQADPNLTFPEYLGTNRSPFWIQFTAVERNQEDKYTKPTSVIQRTVALPLPADLGDNYGYQYADDSLGILSEDVSSEIGRAYDKMLATVQSQGLSRVTGNDPEALVRKQQGGAVNPNLRNAFTGIGYKQHPFNFSLVAKNAKEYMTIKEIVNFFRYFGSPSYSNQATKSFLKEPSRFIVTFGPDALASNLYRPGVCSLSDISVRYNSSGNSVFHEDFSPVEVSLTVTMKEDTLATRERHVRDYGFNPLNANSAEGDF